ncbi:MAG TPA: sodium:proton antiporter [Gemmatimonadales bacterium]|nr:sodium:proton antiporter [Gemmatimonadales bacterium]HYT82136.1 sodium:proton antiporter [Gemmatimonadales bacterium]
MLGADLPLVAVLPFVALLAAIAVGPLVAPRWWHSNRNKGLVAALVSLPIMLYLGVSLGEPGRVVLEEKVRDYVSFVVVIAALFVISGGVHVEGSLSGTPLANTALLGVGAVLANVVGTTGASVLLIRPLLSANRSRRRTAHIVVFFIFLVSNCAGLLTPLGDPPLLLGFLKGVPFLWTLRLWPQWLTVTVMLLAVFNMWDQWVLAREERERRGSQLERVLVHQPLRVVGAYNLTFLVAVVATIVAAGQAGALGRPWAFGRQEVIITLVAAGAYMATPHDHRERNAFSFGPILEVAVLFAGIFVTMAPVLEILNAWSQGRREVAGIGFGISEPWQFFWATGLLSSVLDNAPTYLAFSASAAGLGGVTAHGTFLGAFLGTGPEAARTLAAIATGAVFMGANTYIGNAPNFMVKAIAQEHGVRMPSFFGYMAYSFGILGPIFLVTTLLFFRR